MKTRTARIAGVAASGAAALVLLGAGPASAHVSADKAEVPAGGFTSVGFTVPHGCEESPTTAVAIQIPEGIYNASPQVHPGWTISVENEAVSPPVTTSHGAEVSERVATITFAAEDGNAIPDGYRDVFTVGFQAPDAEGETLHFPVVQTCEVGETAWIEKWDGTGEEPEHPAPAIEVVAAEDEDDGHGSAGGADEGEDVEGEQVASTSDDEDTATTDGIAVAALAVSALALITGGAALLQSRKKV